MWPRDGGETAGRTEAQIQVFSAFWMVAYHCLHYVDFYLWDGTGDWRPPPRFADGPEMNSIGPDGAARLPQVSYSRDDLLEYLEYARRRARSVLGGLTESQLQLRRHRPDHPHRSRTFGELLQINLDHLREHTAQLAGGRDPRGRGPAAADQGETRGS